MNIMQSHNTSVGGKDFGGHEKWKVTADHPVLAIPDKYGLQYNEACAYANSLLQLGYENINVTVDI